MKGMYSKIPAFASDYSGASGVFFELNGFNIFCDPGSCFAATMNLEEPRFAGTGDYCSMQIRENQAVFGIDSKLMENMRKAWDGTKECITIIGTPVPTILGTDYEGMAGQLEKELKTTVYAVNTTGLSTYEEGQKKAFLKLAEKATEEVSDGSVDVNVIGATPLDMWDLNQVKDMIAILKESGFKNPSVWGRNGKIAQIHQASGAKLNIAVSASAIPTVKLLEKKYGTPYIVGFPIGKKAEKRWKEKMKKFLNGDMDSLKKLFYEQNPDLAEKKKIKNAIVVGEQMTSNAIRGMLVEEFGYEDVKVGSFFAMDEKWMLPGDKKFKGEDDGIEFMNQEEYQLVICDPLLIPLLTYKPDKTVLFPHMAVSSRIYKDKSPNCFGEKGTLYFLEQINM